MMEASIRRVLVVGHDDENREAIRRSLAEDETLQVAAADGLGNNSSDFLKADCVVVDASAVPGTGLQEMLSGNSADACSYVVLIAGDEELTRGVDSNLVLYCLFRDTLPQRLLQHTVRAALSHVQLKRTLKNCENAGQRTRKAAQEFVSRVSHDLMAPSRQVMGFCDLLNKRCGGQLGEEGNDYLGFITSAASQLKELLEALLFYARLESKPNVPETISIGEALQKVLAQLQPDIDKCVATVTFDPLPTIVADRQRIHQLLCHLIRNSLQFCRDKPLIQVSCTRVASEWILSVRDNGIGVESKDLQRIFEPCQKLHAQDEYPGAGMGLAICKRIVENGGGRIWCESTAGQGSSFFFALPTQASDID